MLHSQDITPEPAAGSPPERAAPSPIARPRRTALLAGGIALAAVAVVAAALSAISMRPSLSWVAEPAAAASPPVQEAEVAAGDRDLLARQRAALAAERERLYQLSDEAVSTATTIEFGAMRLRAPVYASWAYGWVQSYVTSYQIIGRGFAGGFDHLYNGKPGSTLDAMTAEATGVVREHFRALVVQPEKTQKVLDTEWSRVAELLDQEFLRIERRQEEALVSLRRQASPAAAEALKPSSLPPQARGSLTAETPDIDTVLMRSARPMAARAGILVLRLTEVGSVAAIVGSLGISFGPLTGLAVGVVGIGVVWGVDYIINSIDAALHRDQLESHAVAFVDVLEAETRQRVAAAFRVEIDAHLSTIEASMTERFLDLGRGR